MTDQDLSDRAFGGFEGRLLPMLLTALEDPGARPIPMPPRAGPAGRRLASMTLAAALVITTAVMVSGRSTIEVSAADALADPEEVARELREAGIGATILVVPVPRSAAGTWWHLFFAPGTPVEEDVWAGLKAQVGVAVAGLPEEQRDAGRGIFHRDVLELPRNLGGPVTLVAGRARQPGEQEAPMDNELAPDGAFWCLHLEQRTPGQAGVMLEGMGYDVVWILDTFDAPGGNSRIVQTPPEDFAVVIASFSRPQVIRLHLASLREAERLRRQVGTPTGDTPIPDWAPECPASGDA